MTAVPTASAATGPVVVFGDSYVASPDQFLNFAKDREGSTQLVPADYPRGGTGCLQSPDNWPRRLAANTGREVTDLSCNGETSRSVLERIDAAVNDRHLHPGVSAVLLAVGGNDYSNYGYREGARSSDRDAMQDRFSDHLGQAVDAIRSAAPDARVIVTGLPQITDGRTLCLLHTIPGTPLGVPFPGQQLETAIRDMQRAGAQRHGLDFVDNYALTAGHHTCAPDHERYVAGLVDFTSPPFEMALHPTDLGAEALARNNAAALEA